MDAKTLCVMAAHGLRVSQHQIQWHKSLFESLWFLHILCSNQILVGGASGNFLQSLCTQKLSIKCKRMFQ